MPSPSNGALQVQVKPSVSTFSLEHSALESQGSELHGSGTIKIKCGHEFAKLFSINNHVLSQVIPSPSNGALQVQVKPSVSTLSLEHSALESQGSELHRSGTKK